MMGVNPLRRVIGLPRWLARSTRDAAAGLSELARMPRVTPGTDPVTVTSHRHDGTDAAVVLIHGFGVSERTFGDLPELLARDPAMKGWDLHSLGYDTGLLPDLAGLWSADPEIAVLATYLRTRARLQPLGRYRALALVAHSMGGLVVQRALVDDARLTRRTSHVLLYGTPSGGLDKARWGAFLKAQIRDMATDSAFLTDLRRRWDTQFGDRRPFRLWTIAGDRDVFVPASSSLAPFPPDTHVVIPGNHLEIVQVRDDDALALRALVDALTDGAPGGRWNSARVAVERREFHRAVELLSPHVDELDETHLVDLALALDETGDRDRAIDVLRRHATGTDARGVLAGRLKRLWMAEGRRQPAAEALELYRDAHCDAATANDHPQAAYHAVNVAFLELAFRHDNDAATIWARTALEHCAHSPHEYWRQATEAEAHLLLGDPTAAVDGYRAALTHDPPTRAWRSTHTQAMWIANEIGAPDLLEALSEILAADDPTPRRR